MTASTKPAAGVHLFYLEDAGILFSESTQELHLLNTTAAVIWSLLEEGHDAAGATAALQEMYEVDEERAAQFVAAALNEWTQKRLVGGPFPAAEPASATPAKVQPDAHVAWHEFAPAEQRHYRLLSSRFCLRFSSPAQVRLVHPIIEHLEAAPSSEEIVVDVVAAAQRIVVYRDRVFFADCAGIDALAPVVKSLVWQTAVRDHRFFLDIHAGVIGNRASCILLPAAPGSGKSTLTASLVHAGLEYYSDEVALLEEGNLHVYPVPLAICIKAPGVEALVDRFPDLRRLPVHKRGDGKDVVYLPPPRESLPSTNEPQPVAAVVFPRYAAGASVSLASLTKLDALKQLMDECLVAPPPPAAPKARALARGTGGPPCST